MGRAYKGLEAEEVGRERQAVFAAAAAWAAECPQGVLDVRGCCKPCEVHPRQREALAQARCEKAMDFLLRRCCLPPEKCHASLRLGADFQGVELRAMLRLEVDGTFGEGGSAELQDANALRKVVAAACGASRTGGGSGPERRFAHTLVEVFYIAGPKVGQLRVAALQRELVARGVPRPRLHGRALPGIREEAVFFVYEEFESDGWRDEGPS